MAKTVIRAHMKQRRDTAVNWQAQNPVLLDGEIGIVTDQPDRYKVGDGVTAWNALPLRGFDGNIVQTTGTSRTAVMSQAAVSQSLEYLKDHTVTPEQLAEKQDTLVSGENLKTLNGESLLGSGNIELDRSKYAKQSELQTLTDEVIANEEVTAAALNDLNDRVNAIAENVTGATATKEELAEAVNSLDESIKAIIVDNEKIIASAFNDLNDRVNAIAKNVTGATATKEELAEAVTSLDDSIKAIIVDNEKIIASAFNDLNDRINEIVSRLDALSA